jgi:hypothetical protein
LTLSNVATNPPQTFYPIKNEPFSSDDASKSS